MGKELEQTFLQRHTGQQICEKSLNITNHQGNANQNHNEISLQTFQDSHYFKKKKSVDEVMEKLEPLNTVGGIVNGTATMETVQRFLKKLKNRTTI